MMLVARSFDSIECAQPCLLTIGTFDGVHRGHRYLLEQARERAVEHHYALAIVTFDPCPAVVLRPSLGRYQISSAEQKLSLLGVVEPALVAMLDFTPQLSQLTAGEFMDAIEARLDLRELWFGEDFRFGRDRGGDLPMLVERGRASGFSLHVVNRRTADRESISSSRIRTVLRQGDVDAAIPLLGYPLRRECVSPERARWLDGATDAETFDIEPHLALPADGVYAVLHSVDGRTDRTIAEVRGDKPRFQLVTRGTKSHHGKTTVEFIRHLCSADAYRDSAPAWDSQADAWLTAWQRPAYEPVGHL